MIANCLKKIILFTLTISTIISITACNKKDKVKDTSEDDSTPERISANAPEEVTDAEESIEEIDSDHPEENLPTDIDSDTDGTDESEWTLIDTEIIIPEEPIIEEKKEEEAAIQSIEDITNLDELVAGYEYCYNYDFSYDETVSFEGGYYLVSDTAAIEAYKAECTKYFEAGRYPVCFIEKGGEYFYKPVEDISLTMEMGEDGTGINYSMGEDGTGINYSEDNVCELSYTDNFGHYHFIELTKGDNGFLISYTTYDQ